MRLAAAALVAATLLCAQQSHAQVLDLSTVTCKQFFEGNKDRLDFVVAWLLGYYMDENDPPVLDFGKMKDRAAKLGAYCATNPDHGLVTAADSVMQ
jgi:acid stress chaperone HdeB